MKADKTRLDVLLVQRGLFPSREAARRAIMAGLVRRNGEVVDKPGTQVAVDEVFDVAQPEHQYVSRGGLKLKRAIDAFQLDLSGKVVIDVGASTGGFTDCALQHGAALVFAVDVGYGQLAWKLRTDPRVVVMERTNFRHVDPQVFVPKPSVAVMDVSFISTRLLLPKLCETLTNPGTVISLVKPQFEAGREHVGKGGIVRDPFVHVQVLTGLLDFVYELGMTCQGLTWSPIVGGDGNIEYLARWESGRTDEAVPLEAWKKTAEQVVASAWLEHKGRSVAE
jgi:23S rRNA (cytidine1920-2'-O)/16S rRNA (cytidine1409-2'-O)-methyltransferase